MIETGATGLVPVPTLGYEIHRLKLNQLLATYDINLVTFNIYGSQLRTVEEAERKLWDRTLVVRCYHFLTDDTRLALPLNACREVILGELIKVWYETSGFEVPAKVTRNQEVRMAKAKATDAAAEQAAEGTTATATKEPRITSRSIIVAGLLAGTPNEEILAQVKRHKPNSKADDKHIAYYRHYLEKDGKLEKKPRPVKEKPAAPATAAANGQGETSAPAAKVAAKNQTSQAAQKKAPAASAQGAKAKAR